MRSIIAIGIIFFCSISLSGQYNPTIRSARPGNTVGSYTIGKNVFQLQSGISYSEVFSFDGESKTSRVNWGNTLRLGLLEKLEVSGVILWSDVNFPSSILNDGASGISGTQLGLRYNIRSQKGHKPALAIQARALFRAPNEAFRREKNGMRIVLMTAHRIAPKLGANTNLGIQWPGNGASDVLYAFKLAYRVDDRWVVIGDIFGQIDPFTARFNLGAFYLVNKDFKVDLSVGWWGNNNVKDWNTAVGISWRTDWRQKQ